MHHSKQRPAYSTPEKHLSKVLEALQVVNKECNLYC